MNTYNKTLVFTEAEDGSLALKIAEQTGTEYQWEYRIPQCRMLADDPENPGTDIEVSWKDYSAADATPEDLDVSAFDGADFLKVFRCRMVIGSHTRYTNEFRFNYGLNN